VIRLDADDRVPLRRHGRAILAGVRIRTIGHA
jgi:hypothetical protein